MGLNFMHAHKQKKTTLFAYNKKRGTVKQSAKTKIQQSKQ
jgi:hypothetical protein